MNKILLLFFILYIVHYTLYIPVYAIENDIGYSRIHPASPFYFLKTIREDLELNLAQTYHVKELRQLEFATRRLRETRTLVPINQDLIQPTLERYNAHLKTLYDQNLIDSEILTRIKDSLSIHLAVLQQIYPEVSNPRAKMAIRSAMNRIIQIADVPNFAKLSVCNYFNKEASSSSLNQTEKFVIKERTQKCFDSLKPV